MNNNLNRFFLELKRHFGLFMSISFGLFLFILFFQPFPLDRFDFNDRLIFVAGLAAIVFLSMVLVKILFSLLFLNHNQVEEKLVMSPMISGFSLIVLCSTAFAFYLCYVGDVRITFFVMFKIALMCLVVSVVLRVYDLINELKQQNDLLLQEKKVIQKQVEKYEEDFRNKTVEFISENGTETLTLLVAEVVFIRSADNYVEIVYREADAFRKKLIRNTMKNMEQQVKMFPNFVRCHRICIVNTHFIEKLNCNYSSHWITLKGYNEKIPVSRQYLLKLKEVV